MSPGERIRVKHSPWPERDGLVGVIVDPAIFGGTYPADARSSKDRLIVLLDDDPLALNWRRTDTRWTCVLSESDLELA